VTYALDKGRVARAFSRGAAAYDEHARVQRRAIERLLALALPAAPAPRRVLDVGAGTGNLLAQLAETLPGAALAGVDLAPGMALAAQERAPGAGLAVGDAELLPFRAGAFDLVVSTSMLQWLATLEPAFREARRVLAPGGLVGVALFGGETLCELREAWRAAAPAQPDRTHRFHSAEEVARALAAAGLERVEIERERVVERYADVPSLLRALRRIGANGNVTPATAGLGGRAALERMMQAYAARHGGPEGIPATWEIVYALARSPLRSS
jgi:malonyl-CoA O-methyltransferase